jgi:hypothetical protein
MVWIMANQSTIVFDSELPEQWLEPRHFDYIDISFHLYLFGDTKDLMLNLYVHLEHDILVFYYLV